MTSLETALRTAAATGAALLAHWAITPGLLPALAALGGTPAAMALWTGTVLAAVSAPFALGAPRGLAATLGGALALRGAGAAAPLMTGPPAPMGDAAALVAPLALAAVGAALLLWATAPRRAQPSSRRASLSSMIGIPSRTG